MARYEITSPDGQRFEVTAPDDATEEQVMQYVQQQSVPPAPMPKPAPETNRLKMIGESAVKGLTNLVGLPGTMADVVSSTADATVGKYVTRPALDTIFKALNPVRNAIMGEPSINDVNDRAALDQKLARGNVLSTRNLQGYLTDMGVIGSPEAQPQTPGEKLLARGVEGATSAPFGPVAAIAGTTGGLGAEGARQAAEGTGYEKIAELGGGLVGGMAGSMGADMLARLGRRIVTPLPSNLNAEQQRLAQVMKAEGVPLTAAQKTGSPSMRWVEGVFEKGSLPFTGGAQRAVVEETQKGFNKAVLKRMGVDADTATPEVMARAAQRIGQQFDDLSARTTVTLDQNFVQDVAGAAQKYGAKLNVGQKPVFQSYVDDIAQVGTQMPGATYQATRSDLTRHARAVANSDPMLSQALKGLRNALDDAAGRSVAPGDKAAWETARRQYTAMKTIERAVTGGEGQTGNVSPALLRGELVRRDRAGYARGQGELNDLTRAGNEFVRSLPSSGSSERGTMAALMLGAPGMLMANPALAAAGVATPKLAQLLMNSRPGQAYLSNQVMAAPFRGAGPATGAMAGGLPEANRLAALLLADAQR